MTGTGACPLLIYAPEGCTGEERQMTRALGRTQTTGDSRIDGRCSAPTRNTLLLLPRCVKFNQVGIRVGSLKGTNPQVRGPTPPDPPHKGVRTTLTASSDFWVMDQSFGVTFMGCGVFWLYGWGCLHGSLRSRFFGVT